MGTEQLVAGQRGRRQRTTQLGLKYVVHHTVFTTGSLSIVLKNPWYRDNLNSFTLDGGRFRVPPDERLACTVRGRSVLNQRHRSCLSESSCGIVSPVDHLSPNQSATSWFSFHQLVLTTIIRLFLSGILRPTQLLRHTVPLNSRLSRRTSTSPS